jgi:hypothetical protein
MRTAGPLRVSQLEEDEDSDLGHEAAAEIIGHSHSPISHGRVRQTAHPISLADSRVQVRREVADIDRGLSSSQFGVEQLGLSERSCRLVSALRL